MQVQRLEEPKSTDNSQRTDAAGSLSGLWTCPVFSCVKSPGAVGILKIFTNQPSYLQNVKEAELDKLLGIAVDVENLFMCTNKEEDGDTKQAPLQNSINCPFHWNQLQQ